MGLNANQTTVLWGISHFSQRTRKYPSVLALQRTFFSFSELDWLHAGGKDILILPMLIKATTSLIAQLNLTIHIISQLVIVE
jgi:hypothetical protein